jgi:5-methylcytosine-specific restriction endonuclease McrA
MSREDYKWLYSTPRWRKLRARHLRRHPFCQCPHHIDNKVIATVVDHIKPHKGDKRLFYNPANLMSLQAQCHNQFKQSLERGGSGWDAGCDENGEPLNKDHAWFR